MEYRELIAKSALHHHTKKSLPFNWDLNLYRGCEHGCKYCFAIYSHDYLNDGAFFDRVYYKKGIIEALEKELSSPKWKREVISIGGITDSYQPIEKEMKLMRDVLKLMIKYQTPIIISTKSDLILRDLDLIKELSEITYVNIAFTITTMDEQVREHLEPNSSPSLARFYALNEIRKHTKACTAVHLMPIIPYLTDNRKNLETIYAYASKVGVNYILPGTLYLRGKTKPCFMDFMKSYDPERYEKIKYLYRKGSAPKDYKQGLYQYLHTLNKKYQVSSNYLKDMKERLEGK